MVGGKLGDKGFVGKVAAGAGELLYNAAAADSHLV